MKTWNVKVDLVAFGSEKTVKSVYVQVFGNTKQEAALAANGQVAWMQNGSLSPRIRSLNDIVEFNTCSSNVVPVNNIVTPYKNIVTPY